MIMMIVRVYALCMKSTLLEDCFLFTLKKIYFVFCGASLRF
jgi:hypothetical protein